MLLAVAFALLLATAISACGEDSNSDSGVVATQETTAPPGDGAPVDDSGGGNASFRTPGGDNSIQNYGKEANAAELEEAAVALASFMRARAEDDWDEQCARLADAATKSIEELASRSPQLKGEGCATILPEFLAGVPASSHVNTLTDGVASLRVEGDRGFALYHGAGGVDYYVPMVKEDGKWKVGAVAPSEFP